MSDRHIYSHHIGNGTQLASGYFPGRNSRRNSLVDVRSALFRGGGIFQLEVGVIFLGRWSEGMYGKELSGVGVRNPMLDLQIYMLSCYDLCHPG